MLGASGFGADVLFELQLERFRVWVWVQGAGFRVRARAAKGSIGFADFDVVLEASQPPKQKPNTLLGMGFRV